MDFVGYSCLSNAFVHRIIFVSGELADNPGSSKQRQNIHESDTLAMPLDHFLGLQGHREDFRIAFFNGFQRSGFHKVPSLGLRWDP